MVTDAGTIKKNIEIAIKVKGDVGANLAAFSTSFQTIALAFDTIQNSLKGMDSIAAGVGTAINGFVKNVGKIELPPKFNEFVSSLSKLNDIKPPNLDKFTSGLSALLTVSIPDPKKMADIAKSLEAFNTLSAPTGLHDLAKGIAAITALTKDGNEPILKTAAAITTLTAPLTELGKVKLPNFKNIVDGLRAMEKGDDRAAINMSAKALQIQSLAKSLRLLDGIKLPNFKNIVDGLAGLKDINMSSKSAQFTSLGTNLRKLEGIKLPNFKQIIDSVYKLGSTPIDPSFAPKLGQLAYALELFEGIKSAPSFASLASSIKKLGELKIPVDLPKTLNYLKQEMLQFSDLKSPPNLNALIKGIKAAAEFKIPVDLPKTLHYLAEEMKQFSELKSPPNLNTLIKSLKAATDFRVPVDLPKTLNYLKSEMLQFSELKAPPTLNSFIKSIKAAADFKVSADLPKQLNYLKNEMLQFSELKSPPNLNTFIKSIQAAAEFKIPVDLPKRLNYLKSEMLQFSELKSPPSLNTFIKSIQAAFDFKVPVDLPKRLNYLKNEMLQFSELKSPPNLNNLIKSIESFKELKVPADFTTRISDIADALHKFDKIRVPNLNTLTKSIGEFGKLTLPTDLTSKIGDVVSAFGQFKGIRVPTLKGLSESLEKFKGITIDPTLGTTFKELAAALVPLQGIKVPALGAMVKGMEGMVKMDLTAFTKRVVEVSAVLNKLDESGRLQSFKGFAEALKAVESRLGRVAIATNNGRDAIAKYSYGFASATANLSPFNQKLYALARGLSAVNGGFATLTGFSVVFGGFHALKAVTTYMMEFDDAIKKAGATSRATADEVVTLEIAARRVGEATRYSATDAAHALVELTMAGLNVDEAIGALPGVMQLAAASAIEIKDAAKISTNIMRGYAMSVEDLTYRTKELGDGSVVAAASINDILVAAFTRSNTNLTDLGIAFRYVGPIAKSAGQEFEQTAAILASLAQAGYQGSQAGTTFRRAIGNLLAPTKKMSEVIKEYGLNIHDANGKLLPMTEILADLRNKGVSTGDALELFGKRAGAGMTALLHMSNAELVNMEMNMDTATGAAARNAVAMESGIGGAYRRLVSVLEEVKLAIGRVTREDTTEWFDRLANTIRDNKKAITDAVGALTTLLAYVANITANIVTWVAANGKITLGLTLLGIAIAKTWKGLVTYQVAVVALAKANAAVAGTTAAATAATLASNAAAASSWMVLGGRIDAIKKILLGIGPMMLATSASIMTGIQAVLTFIKGISLFTAGWIGAAIAAATMLGIAVWDIVYADEKLAKAQQATIDGAKKQIERNIETSTSLKLLAQDYKTLERAREKASKLRGDKVVGSADVVDEREFLNALDRTAAQTGGIVGIDKNGQAFLKLGDVILDTTAKVEAYTKAVLESGKVKAQDGMIAALEKIRGLHKQIAEEDKIIRRNQDTIDTRGGAKANPYAVERIEKGNTFITDKRKELLDYQKVIQEFIITQLAAKVNIESTTKALVDQRVITADEASALVRWSTTYEASQQRLSIIQDNIAKATAKRTEADRAGMKEAQENLKEYADDYEKLLKEGVKSLKEFSTASKELADVEFGEIDTTSAVRSAKEYMGTINRIYIQDTPKRAKLVQEAENNLAAVRIAEAIKGGERALATEEKFSTATLALSKKFAEEELIFEKDSNIKRAKLARVQEEVSRDITQKSVKTRIDIYKKMSTEVNAALESSVKKEEDLAKRLENLLKTSSELISKIQKSAADSARADLSPLGKFTDTKNTSKSLMDEGVTFAASGDEVTALKKFTEAADLVSSISASIKVDGKEIDGYAERLNDLTNLRLDLINKIKDIEAVSAKKIEEQQIAQRKITQERKEQADTLSANIDKLQAIFNKGVKIEVIVDLKDALGQIDKLTQNKQLIVTLTAEIEEFKEKIKAAEEEARALFQKEVYDAFSGQTANQRKAAFASMPKVAAAYDREEKEVADQLKRERERILTSSQIAKYTEEEIKKQNELAAVQKVKNDKLDEEIKLINKKNDALLSAPNPTGFKRSTLEYNAEQKARLAEIEYEKRTTEINKKKEEARLETLEKEKKNAVAREEVAAREKVTTSVVLNSIDSLAVGTESLNKNLEESASKLGPVVDKIVEESDKLVAAQQRGAAASDAIRAAVRGFSREENRNPESLSSGNESWGAPIIPQVDKGDNYAVTSADSAKAIKERVEQTRKAEEDIKAQRDKAAAELVRYTNEEKRIADNAAAEEVSRAQTLNIKKQGFALDSANAIREIWASNKEALEALDEQEKIDIEKRAKDNKDKIADVAENLAEEIKKIETKLVVDLAKIDKDREKDQKEAAQDIADLHEEYADKIRKVQNRDLPEASKMYKEELAMEKKFLDGKKLLEEGYAENDIAKVKRGASLIKQFSDFSEGLKSQQKATDNLIASEKALTEVATQSERINAIDKQKEATIAAEALKTAAREKSANDIKQINTNANRAEVEAAIKLEDDKQKLAVKAEKDIEKVGRKEQDKITELTQFNALAMQADQTRLAAEMEGRARIHATLMQHIEVEVARIRQLYGELTGSILPGSQAPVKGATAPVVDAKKTSSAEVVTDADGKITLKGSGAGTPSSEMRKLGDTFTNQAMEFKKTIDAVTGKATYTAQQAVGSILPVNIPVKVSGIPEAKKEVQNIAPTSPVKVPITVSETKSTAPRSSSEAQSKLDTIGSMASNIGVGKNGIKIIGPEQQAQLDNFVAKTKEAFAPIKQSGGLQDVQDMVIALNAMAKNTDISRESMAGYADEVRKLIPSSWELTTNMNKGFNTFNITSKETGNSVQGLNDKIQGIPWDKMSKGFAEGFVQSISTVKGMGELIDKTDDKTIKYNNTLKKLKDITLEDVEKASKSMGKAMDKAFDLGAESAGKLEGTLKDIPFEKGTDEVKTLGKAASDAFFGGTDAAEELGKAVDDLGMDEVSKDAEKATDSMESFAQISNAPLDMDTEGISDTEKEAADLAATMNRIDNLKIDPVNFDVKTEGDEEANTVIKEVDGAKDKEITLTVNVVKKGDTSLITDKSVTETAAAKDGGLIGKIQKFATGGYTRGFRKLPSSFITQGSGGKEDDVPALLQKGEFVQKRAAVNKYGVPFMQALNSGRISKAMLPQFNAGGMVGRVDSVIQKFASGGIVLSSSINNMKRKLEEELGTRNASVATNMNINLNNTIMNTASNMQTPTGIAGINSMQSVFADSISRFATGGSVTGTASIGALRSELNAKYEKDIQKAKSYGDNKLVAILRKEQDDLNAVAQKLVQDLNKLESEYKEFQKVTTEEHTARVKEITDTYNEVEEKAAGTDLDTEYNKELKDLKDSFAEDIAGITESDADDKTSYDEAIAGYAKDRADLIAEFEDNKLSAKLEQDAAAIEANRIGSNLSKTLKLILDAQPKPSSSSDNRNRVKSITLDNQGRRVPDNMFTNPLLKTIEWSKIIDDNKKHADLSGIFTDRYAPKDTEPPDFKAIADMVEKINSGGFFKDIASYTEAKISVEALRKDVKGKDFNALQKAHDEELAALDKDEEKEKVEYKKSFDESAKNKVKTTEEFTASESELTREYKKNKADAKTTYDKDLGAEKEEFKKSMEEAAVQYIDNIKSAKESAGGEFTSIKDTAKSDYDSEKARIADLAKNVQDAAIKGTSGSPVTPIVTDVGSVIDKLLKRGSGTIQIPADFWKKLSKGMLRFNTGGSVPFGNGAIPGKDSILASLTPGEFVVREPAVRMFGQNFFKSLNAFKLPKFNAGGIVSKMSSSSFSTGTASSVRHILDLSFNGSNIGELEGSSTTINSFIDALSMAKLRS